MGGRAGTYGLPGGRANIGEPLCNNMITIKIILIKTREIEFINKNPMMIIETTKGTNRKVIINTKINLNRLLNNLNLNNLAPTWLINKPPW